MWRPASMPSRREARVLGRGSTDFIAKRIECDRIGSRSFLRTFLPLFQQEIAALLEAVGVDEIHALVADFLPESRRVRSAPEADEPVLLMRGGNDLAEFAPLFI